MKGILLKTLLVGLICLPLFTFSQKDTGYKKEFNWNKSSESKTIEVEVKQGADKLSMEFKGKISKGSFNLTAYDPEGNKAAGFSLVCSGENHIHIESGEGTTSTIHSGSGSNNHIHVQSNGDKTTTITTESNGNNQVHVESKGSTNSTVVTRSNGKSKSKVKRKSKHKDDGVYSVVSTNTDSKGAKGVMVKTLDNPMPGTWKFELEVEEVTGTLTAEIEQD